MNAVLDYPFGYGNRLVGQYINLAIYFDVPLDVALARRIIRDYTSRDKNTNVADVEEVSLAGLEQRALEYSCPVVYYDGTKTPGEIVDEILTYINTLNHYDALIDENNDPVYDPASLKAHMDK